MTQTLPTYFISHGGGPWPWVPQMRAMFATLETSLTDMVADLPEPPKAILMISGHWEADDVAIMGAARPTMLYDYSGFPPETYAITYDAPGAPDVAGRVQALLADAAIPAHIDPVRGFDHGVYSVMEIMYPQADVPLLQISLRASYDPAEHLAIGRALAPLRDEGVLIVGSGLSFHNLGLIRGGGRDPSAQFDGWLYGAMMAEPAAREQALLDWEAAPAARISHPQEDHLVPLFVAVGAAEQEAATRIYHENQLMGAISVSSYRFG